jgi:uncharacterized protein YdeI (YjbR/CyaY-like superfamily)
MATMGLLKDARHGWGAIYLRPPLRARGCLTARRADGVGCLGTGPPIESPVQGGNPVKPGKLYHTSDRKEWRAWLRRHYRSTDEVWLVYYKKETGKPRISYNDAVEEALCFGWIDSTVRRLDETRFAQRFSPRKPRSKYSPANKERLRRLVASGKVYKTVLATLGDLKAETLDIAPDILHAIKANRLAWKHFRAYSDSYKRIRIGFIEGARRRPAEFRKRLEYFVRMTEADRQFGFGGIDKYY